MKPHLRTRERLVTLMQDESELYRLRLTRLRARTASQLLRIVLEGREEIAAESEELLPFDFISAQMALELSDLRYALLWGSPYLDAIATHVPEGTHDLHKASVEILRRALVSKLKTLETEWRDKHGID